MENQDFENYLIKRNIQGEKLNEILEFVKKFQNFLYEANLTLETLSYNNIYQFSENLIKLNENCYSNYVNLLYYGYFLNNTILIVAMMEILDGWEMFPNLSIQLEENYGSEFKDEILLDIGLPPQGIHPKKKPEFIMPLVNRIIEKLGPEKSIEFFKTGLRDKYPDSYTNPHETFRKVNDIDEFLKIKHQNLVNTLENHFKDNTLFFTQPVDASVLEFVRRDQQISAGIRVGNKIMMYKIPYMTSAALKESDQRKRNYFICHNPLIREALLEKDSPISPIYCNCSGGFMKNFWEAILECKVDVELIESVMDGGKFCRFAIHLPEEVMKKFVKNEN